MSEYICPRGCTWDVIAFDAYGDEFMMDFILQQNPEFSDVVIFEGGEKINVPARGIVAASTIAPPWDDGGEAIIKATNRICFRVFLHQKGEIGRA